MGSFLLKWMISARRQKKKSNPFLAQSASSCILSSILITCFIMLFCSGSTKANTASQQSPRQLQELAGPLCLQEPYGPGPSSFPWSLGTTQQPCRAPGQPGVQGRWLGPLWQGCRHPGTISCVLGEESAHGSLLSCGAAAAGGGRSSNSHSRQGTVRAGLWCGEQ